MRTGLTHDIFRSWKMSSRISKVRLLGEGRILDANLKVRVKDGGRAEDDILGNPFLVWAPVSLISDNRRMLHPEANLPLWNQFNSEAEIWMRTLSLLAKCEDMSDDDDSSAIEIGFIVAALRMLCALRHDLAELLEVSFVDFCRLIEVNNHEEIWGKKGWKTLPCPPPQDFRLLNGDGHEIGRFLRAWHDNIFSKFAAAEAWPRAAGVADAVPYQSVIDRGACMRSILQHHDKSYSVSKASDDWRAISRQQLERLIWLYPRQKLAMRLGVTDMGISKRAKKERIAQPPRGFWQKIGTIDHNSMVLFLLGHNVIAPTWWHASMSLAGKNSDPMELEDIGLFFPPETPGEC